MVYSGFQLSSEIRESGKSGKRKPNNQFHADKRAVAFPKLVASFKSLGFNCRSRLRRKLVVRFIVKIFFLLLLLFILSCTVSEQKPKEEQRSIYGKWYSADYFDSTIIHKKIYEYSTYAAWCYLLDIQKDSSVMVGFNEDIVSKTMKSENNTIQIGDLSQYNIIQMLSSKESDSVLISEGGTYIEKQGRGINFVLYRGDPKILDLQDYFRRNIFVGHYQNINNHTILKFEDDGAFNGIDDYTKYEIAINFWDMIAQMDHITISNSTDEKRLVLSWEFIGDTLNLYSVKDLYENGDWDGAIRDSLYLSCVKVE